MTHFDYFPPDERELQPQRNGRRLLFKGGSSSSSSSTETTSIDKRQVVDMGSIGVSSDNSTVNVNLLDAGAIDKAINLAKTGSELNQKSLTEVLGFAGQVLKLTNDNVKLVQASQGAVGDAYKTAQEISTGQRMLIAGGLVIAGIVAVNSFGKK